MVDLFVLSFLKKNQNSGFVPLYHYLVLINAEPTFHLVHFTAKCTQSSAKFNT